MDLTVLFKALLRRKWIILGVTIFSIALALFITRNYKEVYKSSAQLATGFTVKEEVSVTNERFNLFEADVKFNNLIATINSPVVFSLLSYNLILHDLNPGDSPFRNVNDLNKLEDVMEGKSRDYIVSYIKMKLDSTELLSTYNLEDIQIINLLKLYGYNNQSLRNIMNVTRIRGTDYIVIDAYTEHPELSAFMVNTLTKVFLQYYQNLRNERSYESVKSFTKILEQKRLEMEQKADALRTFKSSNSVLNFDMESSNIIDQISELENRRDEENRKIQNLSVEIDDLNNRIKNISSTASSSNTSLNSEIIDLRQQISELNSRFVASGSNNSILIDSLKILRSILQEKLMQTESGSISNQEVADLISKRHDKETEKVIARKNLESINSALWILKGDAGDYASIEATIASLQRELNMATQEYQDAQERYNTSLDISMASGNSIRQILMGQPPEQPQPSQRIIITGLSGITSFALLIIIFVFIEYIDISVKTPSNFKKVSGTNLIGVIISFNLKKHDLFKIMITNPVKKDVVRFVENIRKLRYEIESSSKKVFLITSTLKNQGKTTLILALTLALSKINKKVLVIDANFSNNALTRIFRAYPVLEEFPYEKEDLSKFITHASLKHIHVIGSKGGNYSPSEILSSKGFYKIIDEFKSEYDYIFIEGAALNDYADSKELEPYVEEILAVFSANEVIRQPDLDSFSYLNNLGVKFQGTILNNVEDYNLDQ